MPVGDRRLLIVRHEGQINVYDADGCGQLDRAQRVVVVAADEHHGRVRTRDPREPGPEARLQDRVGDRSGDVGLVELQRGADVDHRRVALLDLTGRERLCVERPAFQAAT